MPTVGACELQVKWENSVENVLFVIVPDNEPPTLGLKTSEALDRIKSMYSVQEQISGSVEDPTYNILYTAVETPSPNHLSK